MDASEDLRAQRLLRITALAVGSLAFWRLLFWVPTREMGALNSWLFLTTDPFPQAIFLIAAALVYRRRNSLRSAMGSRGSPVLAVLPLLMGSSLFAWGHYVDAMDLLLVSFMLIAIGVGLLWFGARFARELAIPLVILAFAFPAPAVVTNQAFYALRLSTAAHATSLLQFVGIPILREGNVLIGSEVVARVVDSCSGLRSMEMLTLAAIFFAAWFPARRLRQVLLIVLAPAIAYLFNLVRVGVMTVAPTSEFSANHAMQGLAVFFGAISCLLVADRIIGRLLPARPRVDRASRRTEAGQEVQPDGEQGPQAEEGEGPQPEGERGLELRAGQGSRPEGERGLQPEDGEDLRPAADSQSNSDGTPEGATQLWGLASSKGRVGAASLVALAVALLGVSIWMPRWERPESDRLVPAKLPRQVDGWKKVRKDKIDSGYLWTVRYRKHNYWTYARDGDEVSVFIGYDDRSRRGRSLLSRKNGLPGHGWEVEERSSASLEPVEAHVERVVARSETRRVLTYHWYEGTEGLASETLHALLAADQSPFRRSQPARVIRVATALGSTPPERSEDETRLRAFTSSLVAEMRE